MHQQVWQIRRLTAGFCSELYLFYGNTFLKKWTQSKFRLGQIYNTVTSDLPATGWLLLTQIVKKLPSWHLSGLKPKAQSKCSYLFFVIPTDRWEEQEVFGWTVPLPAGGWIGGGNLRGGRISFRHDVRLMSSWFYRLHDTRQGIQWCLNIDTRGQNRTCWVCALHSMRQHPRPGNVTDGHRL